MKGPVSESKMGAILVHAKLAANNVRAQRDRLLQLHLQLQQPPLATPTGEEPDGAGAAALMLKEVASGLVDVSFGPIEMGARGLSTTIKLAAMNGVGLSLPLDFGVIPDEELFDRLVALRLPRRPVIQAQAFAHVEAAYYAVKSNQEHFVPRCAERLGYPYQPYSSTDDQANGHESSEDSFPETDEEDSRDGAEICLPDPVTAAATGHLAETGLPDPVAAVTEDLAKIGLSTLGATATERAEDSSKTGLPAMSASVAGDTPQRASVDLDQARAYLDRACTLANLAVKHIDLAVTTISSFTDPKDVANISSFVARLGNST